MYHRSRRGGDPLTHSPTTARDERSSAIMEATSKVGDSLRGVLRNHSLYGTVALQGLLLNAGCDYITLAVTLSHAKAQAIPRNRLCGRYGHQLGLCETECRHWRCLTRRLVTKTHSPLPLAVSFCGHSPPSAPPSTVRHRFYSVSSRPGLSPLLTQSRQVSRDSVTAQCSTFARSVLRELPHFAAIPKGNHTVS